MGGLISRPGFFIIRLAPSTLNPSYVCDIIPLTSTYLR